MNKPIKYSKQFGSAYKVENDVIMYCPVMVDNSLDKFDGEENWCEVETHAFSKEEEQPFVDEMVRLFGEKVKQAEPISLFSK